MLPEFTITGYTNLLRDLCGRNFQVVPISAMPQRRPNSIYLRHDVDFSPELATTVSEIENSLGVVSTFFILLAGHYNPFNAEVVSAIKKIKSLGHEIGLQYDLMNWPQDKHLAQVKLEREVKILESIVDSEIKSIVMHQPSLGGDDIFATSDYLTFVNPTYYQRNDPDLSYVSDSCRAWRDDTLLKFINRGIVQNRLMLNTHPESWLSTKKMNRINYLEEVLFQKVTKSVTDYYLGTVKHLWQTQPGPVNGFGNESE